jgi:hypothetical protein
MATPAHGYVPLAGSDKKPLPQATRTADAHHGERLTVSVYLRRRTDAPAVPPAAWRGRHLTIAGLEATTAYTWPITMACAGPVSCACRSWKPPSRRRWQTAFCWPGSASRPATRLFTGPTMTACRTSAIPISTFSSRRSLAPSPTPRRPCATPHQPAAVRRLAGRRRRLNHLVGFL